MLLLVFCDVNLIIYMHALNNVSLLSLLQPYRLYKSEVRTKKKISCFLLKRSSELI